MIANFNNITLMTNFYSHNSQNKNSRIIVELEEENRGKITLFIYTHFLPVLYNFLHLLLSHGKQCHPINFAIGLRKKNSFLTYLNSMEGETQFCDIIPDIRILAFIEDGFRWRTVL